MIIATLRMMVQPERRSELIDAIRGMLEPVRVERGCLSYRFYEDIENRNALILLEEWSTQEDLEKHIRTDKQRRLFALMDLLSQPPELRFHTVSGTAGMDLVEDVLRTAELR